MPIQQCLLSNSQRRAIKKVFSHPQALGQCRSWLQNNLPKVEVIETSSTTRAAGLAAQETNAAAIASSLAAERYDLRILEADIQDNTANITRFFVLGRQCSPPTGHDRTSILFSVAHQAGALHRVLAPFRRYKINIVKIESRPAKKASECFLFVDCDGHIDDRKLARALEDISPCCKFLKVLGSYPNSE